MSNKPQPIIIFDFMRTLYDPETSQLLSGAAELLNELHGRNIPLYLVSRKEGQREAIIDELGIRKYFTSIELVESKREAMERIKKNHHKKHIWVVGDRVRGEIKEGNRIGAITVWFKAGRFAGEEPMLTEEKPDFRITKLKDLLELLN